MSLSPDLILFFVLSRMQNYGIYMKKIVFCVCIILFFARCAHLPKSSTVSTDLTSDEIIVLAQKEADNNNYAAAKAYYEILAERFATDTNILNIAEFEIAHILIKQRKYKQAHGMLTQILERFEGQGSALLKPEYKKLAEIDLEKIKDKVK